MLDSGLLEGIGPSMLRLFDLPAASDISTPSGLSGETLQTSFFFVFTYAQNRSWHHVYQHLWVSPSQKCYLNSLGVLYVSLCFISHDVPPDEYVL